MSSIFIVCLLLIQTSLQLVQITFLLPLFDGDVLHLYSCLHNSITELLGRYLCVLCLSNYCGSYSQDTLCFTVKFICFSSVRMLPHQRPPVLVSVMYSVQARSTQISNLACFLDFRRYVPFALAPWGPVTAKLCSLLNAPTSSISTASLQMCSTATKSAQSAVLYGRSCLYRDLWLRKGQPE